MKEIWKDVVGYEGLYKVSNKGNVYSIRSKMNLKQDKPKGYRRVKLYSKGNTKRIKVHQLVAKTFIPNPMSKKCVNHINGIKHDNRVENLEWVTDLENRKHAKEIGLMKKGEKHPMAKLSKEQVLEIRRLWATGNYLKIELSRMYKVDPTTIKNIVDRRQWKHI